MAPSSRFASSLKPNVAYLVFELLSALEEADDLALLGVRGHPVPGLRERTGALALTMAWIRSAMARSGSGISAIFASTARSPAALRWPRARPP